MADDVVVQFGARIDQLVSAVNEVKSQLSSVEATVTRLGDTFTSLGGKIKAALIGAGIVEFIDHMGDAGLEAERAAARLGVTTKSIGDLKVIAKLTGTDFDTLVLSIERLSLGVQRSTRDAFSPQAEALRVLHLNARDLIGLPADRYFDRLADAVSKFNPSLNLNNALVTLGGRGLSNMLPVLLQGSEGFRKFREEAERNRVGLEGFAKGAAETHFNFTLLGMSIEGAAKQLFIALKPGIDAALIVLREMVLQLREWAKGLTSSDIKEGMINFVTKTIDMAIAAATFIQKIIDAIQTLIDKYDELKKKATEAYSAVSGGEQDYVGRLSTELLVLAGIFDKSKLFTAGQKPIPALEELDAEIKDKQDKAPGWIKWAEDFRKRFEAALRGTGEGGAPKPPGGGDDAAALNEARRRGVEAAIARVNAEIDAIKEGLTQKKILYDLDVDLFNTTENRKFERTMEATRQAYAAEAEKLLAIRNLWPAHSKEWEDAERKRLQVSRQFDTEMIKLNADSIKSMAANIREWTDALQSSFNSSLRGLLAGTTTFKDAFKKVLGDMLIFFIEFVEKMVLKWITGKAAELVATQSVEGAKAAAQVSGAAAGEAGTLPIRIAKFTSDITADAASTFAGVFANLAPILGPFAAGPAGIAEGTVLAQMAAVPKLDVGAWEVPRDMLANIHAGEMVVPAGPAEAMRRGTGAGINFSISAVDGAGMASWLRKGGAQMIAHAVSNAYNLNPSLRPRY